MFERGPRACGCRFLLQLLVAAVAAAGCAPRSPVPVAVATPPPAPGIDNIIYGPAGTRAVPALAAPPPGSVALLPPPPAVAVVPPMAYAPALLDGAHTLDSGDRLRIVVFGQEG